MKNRKQTSLIAALLMIALIISATMLFGGKKDLPVQQGNLLENGDFSAVTGSMPDGWNTGMWVTNAGASYLEAATLADGTKAVLVENVAANDARFEQTVSVRENATYKLTARVMAEGCDPDQIGANVSFLGVFGTSDDVHDTNGQWETLTLYAQTGDGQKDATVCVRLGGYGSEATGRAWFTDVSLVQVESVPVGAFVLDLATPEPQKEAAQKNTGSKAMVIPGLIAAGCAYVLLGLALMRTLLCGGRMDARRGLVKLGVLLMGALALRVALAGMIRGYGVDMGCFSAWAGKMASGGPGSFYEEGYFCDYPPGYMLVLGLLGWIANLTGISLGTASGELLLKTVPIFCDILLALGLFYATDRVVGRKPALSMAALVAFSPAFVIAGACWGQIDAVLCVMLVGVLLLARAGKWRLAIPVFALAVLAKPQAGLLAPLGVVALVRDVMQNPKARKRAGVGLLLGVLATIVIALPFSANQDSAFWLVDKYLETLSSYAYATLSTGNLMFLLGGNWTPNGQILFGPVTYGMLGTVLMALSFVFGVVVYLRGRDRKRLMLASAVTLQLIFVLGSKMHERYILPALVLLLLAYIETGDIRLLISSLIATAASAVNIGVVLAFEHLVAPNLWLGHLIGAVQMIAASLTVWAAISLSLGREPLRLKMRAAKPMGGGSAQREDMSSAAEVRMRDELLHGRDYKLHMGKADWAVMLGLTLIYGVVGFWGLGDTKAPQGGYTSTAAGEYVIIDLGERHENFHVYYYGGVSETAFSVADSDDGVSFRTPVDAKYLIGDCYKWQAVRQPIYDDRGTVTDVSSGMLSFSGRYLRIEFEGAASALWEIAAVDEDGNVLAAVSAEGFGGVEGRMSDANSLIDEQGTVPAVPSYMNSMYFDEIYHARTGYEHAHGQSTYETTHPPLGKVLMGLCIKAMGMTPFAWRFAGALCGVLMIPAMYLLSKTLLGGSLWPSVCTLLLASDCMHFTQTRIATIDSFPVLFMMLMFLFMARWMKMSFYHQRLRDTFVPLALSGVFMGLAIASKWIGCYGAAGLAVLFFARFYQLWRQSVYAKAHESEDPAFARAAAMFKDRGIRTILACFVFFVFVPIAIYVASYIPYLAPYGGFKWNMATLRRLWDAQTLMLDYHANLVAEHYFASPWYEWPLIIKPMWYYQADFRTPGMVSSILSFGNPAVWWTGLAGILFVLVYSVYRNALPALGAIAGREDENDRVMPIICVAFLSGYLPWVLVSRLTFIYHYFASVPWIIIATALGLKYLARHRRKLAYGLAIVLGIAAVALFIAFYPLASGVEVPRAWCDAVNWFGGWMWY